MGFETPQPDLHELLREVETGKVQLPDFQREWKWDVEHIRSLLASVSLGYPIGVLMMLETGGEEVQFQAQPIAGAPDSARSTAPERLLLDGQQRVTSLYQALESGQAVGTLTTRNKRISRWFYVDIDKAIDDGVDRIEAIIDVPEDRMDRGMFGREVVADWSTRRNEVHAGMFPLSIVFNLGDVLEWFDLYTEQSPQNREKRKAFLDRVVTNFTGYKLPVILLKKDTTRAAVCNVFEKVNTGGVPLNVFELLTATFAVNGFKLGDDWEQCKGRLSRFPALQGIGATELLQGVTLLSTRERQEASQASGGDRGRAPGISCRRDHILQLTLDDYQRWADRLTEAFLWAAAFVGSEHIYSSRDLPYSSQLVPLAATRVILGHEAETAGAAMKLRQWFWSGVLGELYGGTTETRMARDVPELVAWLQGGNDVPSTVNEAIFDAARLLTLSRRNSAAYKGISALLMKGGCRDWVYEQDIDHASFYDLRIDIHHVFPQKWCKDPKNGVDAKRRESIVNKTPLSARTNRQIGGAAPSRYLPKVLRESGTSEDHLDERIKGHLIDFRLLRKDDFEGFFANRAEALLDLIEAAMGKPVVGRQAIDGLLEASTAYDLDDGEDAEWAGVDEDAG
ncbi:MAG: DUF262 domain-containing protein [Actinomycetota bacterium]|jgi:hypothetical protein|nr:DUF262 domain-containing protein [Actinomycetota bacterium]